MLSKKKRSSLVNYMHQFIRDSRSVGILLLFCTIISLLCSNLSFGKTYLRYINYEFDFFDYLHLPHSPVHLINDGLMAVFFFLAGMEIKRELLEGELSSVKKAILPGAAAIGGMLIPAIIYFIITKGTRYQNGWGIPMATDIAFSLGVASLLGKKFSVTMKVFLTALAVIDDLGAILIIAFFYSSHINIYFLLIAGIIIGSLFLLNRYKIKFGIGNFFLGILLWYCVFNSGIHATVAGVLFALMVPVEKLQQYEHAIHKFVNFIVLPLFALANTAIILPNHMLSFVSSRLSIGIITGLFLGKPIGIFFACWLMVKKKFAELPIGTTWHQVCGVGLLAGIGFTMSIFITSLAFSNNTLQDTAKVAILLAALFSIVIAFMWMHLYPFKKKYLDGVKNENVK